MVPPQVPVVIFQSQHASFLLFDNIDADLLGWMRLCHRKVIIRDCWRPRATLPRDPVYPIRTRLTIPEPVVPIFYARSGFSLPFTSVFYADLFLFAWQCDGKFCG
jgi:hypothetical protein